MSALTLDALRQALSQAGDEWGATIAIERRPSVAARLHAAEHALADPTLTSARMHHR